MNNYTTAKAQISVVKGAQKITFNMEDSGIVSLPPKGAELYIDETDQSSGDHKRIHGQVDKVAIGWQADKELSQLIEITVTYTTMLFPDADWALSC